MRDPGLLSTLPVAVQFPHFTVPEPAENVPGAQTVCASLPLLETKYPRLASVHLSLPLVET